MRVFLSGNEEVAKFHLPVVQSRANEFAKQTEKRGLKQNAFTMLFKDTGAVATVLYCYGQINVAVDAPFRGGVETAVKVKERKLYEWNKVADISRVCRGDKGAMLGLNEVYICTFDADAVDVIVGSIALADTTIPASLREGAMGVTLPINKRYVSYIQDMFFAWRLDRFQFSLTEPAPVYVAQQGLFEDSFSEYKYTQLFRMDDIYIPGDYVFAATLPSTDLYLTTSGILILYAKRSGEIAHTTDVSPEAASMSHPGTNMTSPQESVFWNVGVGGAGGLWAGAAKLISPVRNDSVAYFSGTTAQAELVNQFSTYDPPHNPDAGTFLNMFSSTITLDVNINFVDSDNQLQLVTFRVLDGHIVTDPSFDANECVYQKLRVYSALGNESTYTHPTLGTRLKTGDYAYTLKGANIQYVGPHVYVTTIGATPIVDFFVRTGDSWSAYKLTNATGYELSGTPQFSNTGGTIALKKEIGIIEPSRDSMSFVGCKYYEENGTTIAESHHIGIFSFETNGLGGCELKELILFVDFDAWSKTYFWFSENYETIVLKGTASQDGIWVRSGSSYTQIVTGFSGYTEPIYLSRDGSVVALKDKIYVNGVLAIEPVECVGVFHTHDYFVDKISATQFAIKDMTGTIVDTTPDGLYNFYELTEDSSYALLSKTWWTEEDDKNTDVALVVGFADGPVKFETTDQPLLRQMDPANPRISPRFESTTSYYWPTTWARIYTPNTDTSEIYAKQSNRTLVSCREDGFAERANNFTEAERVSAFLWHPDLGLLQRLMNTVTPIPYDVLNQRTETPMELEG